MVRQARSMRPTGPSPVPAITPRLASSQDSQIFTLVPLWSQGRRRNNACCKPATWRQKQRDPRETSTGYGKMSRGVRDVLPVRADEPSVERESAGGLDHTTVSHERKRVQEGKRRGSVIGEGREACALSKNLTLWAFLGWSLILRRLNPRLSSCRPTFIAAWQRPPLMCRCRRVPLTC